MTRALTLDDNNREEEYVLVETRNDLAPIVRTITQDKSFTKSTITGLVVWERSEVTVARIGPRTLAIGSLGEVDKLVQVRLGTRADLKIDDPLLESFQTLNTGSALRLVSRDPDDLRRFSVRFCRLNSSRIATCSDWK